MSFRKPTKNLQSPQSLGRFRSRRMMAPCGVSLKRASQARLSSRLWKPCWSPPVSLRPASMSSPAPRPYPASILSSQSLLNPTRHRRAQAARAAAVKLLLIGGVPDIIADAIRGVNLAPGVPITVLNTGPGDAANPVGADHAARAGDESPVPDIGHDPSPERLVQDQTAAIIDPTDQRNKKVTGSAVITKGSSSHVITAAPLTTQMTGQEKGSSSSGINPIADLPAEMLLDPITPGL